MTIQNGLLHRDAAYLWSDTAHWDLATGRRVLVSAKTYQGALWPWAVAISGDSHGSAEGLSGLPALTPSGLLEAAAENLRAEADDGRLHRMLFAWPEAQRARLCFISSEAPEGFPSLTPHFVRSYLCWGSDADSFAPFKGRTLTPDDMREIVKLQMADYDCHLFPNGIADDGVSDVVETKVSPQTGIEHRQLRLIKNEWCEVQLGDGFRWLEAA